MQGTDLKKIEASISTSRLNTYVQLTNSNEDRAKLIYAYQWNKHVSSSIYPIIQCLEVSLRNAIHNAATKYHKTSSWFDFITREAGHDLFINDMKKNPLKNGQYYRKGVSKGSKKGLKTWTSYHENMLKNSKNKLSKEGKSQSADRIVAELTFGFWVDIFTKPYHNIKNERLWPNLEADVFPNLSPSERNHSKIYGKLKEIKNLRNRLSHHEPVWKNKNVVCTDTAIQYLNSVVEDMLNIIKGISVERYQLLNESGRVDYFKEVCSKIKVDEYLSK